MANFDWNTRVYSINDKKQDLIYVGEARLESIKGYQPFGAGVLYDKRGEQIIISESLPDITGATIKSNSIQTTLGIYQKGELTGPAILSDITGVTLSPFSNKDNKPIKAIVKNVKSWIDTVSRKYSQEAKRQAIAEQRRKEEARKAEIKRIEKEAEVNSTINAALKELL